MAQTIEMKETQIENTFTIKLTNVENDDVSCYEINEIEEN